MTPAFALVLTLAAQASAPVTVEQLTAPEKRSDSK